ncbi:hypothetical protein [Streptomyces sp. NPDC001508]|uniref:hypothetical protein n=1 Tax=Streptomyces sp. NPDC001508 TaxID=3154656 RepID=UPI003317D543
MDQLLVFSVSAAAGSALLGNGLVRPGTMAGDFNVGTTRMLATFACRQLAVVRDCPVPVALSVSSAVRRRAGRLTTSVTATDAPGIRASEAA